MPDHDEIGTPAWEAAVLRRQADLCESLVPEQAAALRRRADELAGDLAEVFTMSKEEAAERIVRAISGPAEPVAYTGPPCMRCGGDRHDHILTAGPNDGPDEYRCLLDEVQDVIGDMKTADPPAEAYWVEVVSGVAAAHARSLITHDLPPRSALSAYLAEMASHAVYDDGRGHLYRWRPADG